MKHLLTLLSLLLIAGLTGASAEDDWSIEIVPSGVSEDVKIIDADSNDPYLFVILTNKTDRKLKVWREWNSWGSGNLTFTAKPEEGSAFTLRRTPVELSWNMSEATIVEPRMSFVCQASLCKKISGRFEGFPAKFEDGKATIQAHFSIKEDDYTRRYGVWTGSVSSAPMEVLIRKDVSER